MKKQKIEALIFDADLNAHATYTSTHVMYAHNYNDVVEQTRCWDYGISQK